MIFLKEAKSAPKYLKEIVECYVRGLTIDLNRIELNRFKKLEEETVREEKILAVHMLEMAKVFENFHPLLHREIILTAFSLKPEKPLYDMVPIRSFQTRVRVLYHSYFS